MSSDNQLLTLGLPVQPKAARGPGNEKWTSMSVFLLTTSQLLVWFPDPSAFRFRGGRGGRAGGRRKGLVNNLALARIHGSIPAVSVDEGKNTNLE